MQSLNQETAMKIILNTLRKKDGIALEPVLRSAVKDRKAFTKAMLQLINEGYVYVNYCKKPPVIILLDD